MARSKMRDPAEKRATWLVRPLRCGSRLRDGDLRGPAMNYGDFNVGSDGRGSDQIASFSMVEVPIHGVSNPANLWVRVTGIAHAFRSDRSWWGAGSEAPFSPRPIQSSNQPTCSSHPARQRALGAWTTM